MTSGTHRRPVIEKHRARPTEERTANTMESYRNQIIAMLDTIQDPALMRLIHSVVRAILLNR